MIYVRSRVWFRVLALLLESFGRLTGSTGGWQVAALRQERQAHDSGVTLGKCLSWLCARACHIAIMKKKKTLLKQTAIELTVAKRLSRQKRRKARRSGGLVRANARRTAEVVEDAAKSIERHRSLLQRDQAPRHKRRRTKRKRG
jgi:hypothetical protein